MMTLSENSHDSEQNLRWIAWEKENRRTDRITEKRMALVFISTAVILLVSVLYVILRIKSGAL
jgi:hypothetical protein